MKAQFAVFAVLFAGCSAAVDPPEERGLIPVQLAFGGDGWVYLEADVVPEGSSAVFVVPATKFVMREGSNVGVFVGGALLHDANVESWGMAVVLQRECCDPMFVRSEGSMTGEPTALLDTPVPGPASLAPFFAHAVTPGLQESDRLLVLVGARGEAGRIGLLLRPDAYESLGNATPAATTEEFVAEMAGVRGSAPVAATSARGFTYAEFQETRTSGLGGTDVARIVTEGMPARVTDTNVGRGVSLVEWDLAASLASAEGWATVGYRFVPSAGVASGSVTGSLFGERLDAVSTMQEPSLEGSVTRWGEGQADVALDAETREATDITVVHLRMLAFGVDPSVVSSP